MNLSIFFLILNIIISSAQESDECHLQPGDELIWEYDVRRSRMIGAYQEADAEYGPANVIITCMRINSLSDEDNGAVWVTAGGIGYHYVKMKFRSKYSRGLRYRVFMYGRRIGGGRQLRYS